MSRKLLATDSPKYLKRLARILNEKGDVYSPAGRLYAFDGGFKVVGSTIQHRGYVIEHERLTDGNGRSIVASREA